MKTKTPCIGTNLCTALTTLCIDKQRQICFLPFFKNCRSSLLIIWLSSLIVRIILIPRQTTKTRTFQHNSNNHFLALPANYTSHIAYIGCWQTIEGPSGSWFLVMSNLLLSLDQSVEALYIEYTTLDIQRNKNNAPLHKRVSPFHNSRHKCTPMLEDDVSAILVLCRGKRVFSCVFLTSSW